MHRASYTPGSIPSKAPSPEQSHELDGSVATSPIASENKLVVGDERGILVVPFDDQERPRRVEPPGAVAGTPCLDGETVYVTSDGRLGGTDSAYVSAITASAGTKWQTKLPTDIVTMPTLRHGNLFIRSGNAYLALDADSGKTHWRNPDANRLIDGGFLAYENFGPAVGDDVVVFPDDDGITAADPANGDIRWRRKLEKVRSCPTVADGTVYVADVASGVHAFDVATGDRRWTWPGEGCWSPPAVSNGRVYATEKNDVVALGQGSGDVEWRTRKHGLHGAVQSGISVVGDSVLASSSSLGLTSVRTASNGGSADPGTLRWTLGGHGFNTPIVVEDRIVFVDYGGEQPSLRVMQ